jgi:hypothetical protein
VPLNSDVGDRITTVGEHHGHISEDLSSIME